MRMETQLPGVKHADDQLRLWETPLGNHGTVRASLGNFVEILSARMFDAVRFKTNSMVSYCPDVGKPGEWYGECKSAGKSNQTFIYAGRLVKDRKFIAGGNDLYYIVWHHAAETKLAKTERELWALFLANMRAIYVTPFAAIDGICKTLREEKLNSNYGHADNPIYGSGYRLPIKRISETDGTIKIDWVVKCQTRKRG